MIPGVIASSFRATSTGLLSQWLMNDGSGTTAVDSAGARNLTLTNGPTWGAGSVILDGTDDYLVRSSVDFGLNGGTELSFSAYIKTTATTGRIMQKAIGSGYYTLWFEVEGSGSLKIELDSLTANKWAIWHYTIPTFNNGSFHHIAFTYKKNSITSADGILYFDKSVTASSSFEGADYDSSFLIDEVSNTFTLGCRPTSFDLFWGGELKDVRVYNKQLSAGEVTALP